MKGKRRARHVYLVNCFHAWNMRLEHSKEFPNRQKALTYAEEMRNEGHSTVVVMDGKVVVKSFSPR